MAPRTRTQRAKENAQSTFVLPRSPIVLVPKLSSLRAHPYRRVQKSTLARPTISSLPPSSPVPTSSYPEELITSPAKHDPFGFIAAEERLKARKSPIKAKVRRILQPKDTVDTNKPTPPRKAINSSIKDRETPKNSDVEKFIPSTPTHTRTFLDYSLLSDASVQTPMGHVPQVSTPKLRRRKIVLPTTPGPSSPVSYSLPQTPSPSKRRRLLPLTGDDEPFDNADNTYIGTDEENQPVETGKSKERGKEKEKEKPVAETKKSTSGESTGEDSLTAEKNLGFVTEELQALLPRRPAGRPASKQSTKRSTNEPTRGRKRSTVPQKRPRSKSQTNRKPRSKATKREESVALDDADEEKFDKERASRIEYFKQLDDYKMPEEKVYVI